MWSSFISEAAELSLTELSNLDFYSQLPTGLDVLVLVPRTFLSCHRTRSCDPNGGFFNRSSREKPAENSPTHKSWLPPPSYVAGYGAGSKGTEFSSLSKVSSLPTPSQTFPSALMRPVVSGQSQIPATHMLSSGRKLAPDSSELSSRFRAQFRSPAFNRRLRSHLPESCHVTGREEQSFSAAGFSRILHRC